MEPGCPQFLPEAGQRADGRGVVPLAENGHQRAEHKQNPGDRNNDPGVQGELFCSAVLKQVMDDDEADPAEDDEHPDGSNDHRIPIVVAEADERLLPAKDIESGVAEGGDGKENRDENTARAIFSGKSRHEQQRSRRFHDQRGEDDNPDKPLDVVPKRSHRFFGQMHPAQAQFFADKQVEKGGEGHEAEPADLDQHKDYALAERRPVGIGVVDDKSGHTGGGSRGKKAVQERRNDPFPAGKREHQKQCPD